MAFILFIIFEIGSRFSITCFMKIIFDMIGYMKRHISYIVIVIVCVCGGFGIKAVLTEEPTVEELLFEVPQVEESLSENEKIEFAFDSFKSVAKEMKKDYSRLCKDGLIDTQKKPLKQIAEHLISYRVLAPYPLEFATTQEEAGIICVASKDRFALSIQLNLDDNGVTKKLCIDSLGQRKNSEVNQEKIICK